MIDSSISITRQRYLKCFLSIIFRQITYKLFKKTFILINQILVIHHKWGFYFIEFNDMLVQEHFVCRQNSNAVCILFLNIENFTYDDAVFRNAILDLIIYELRDLVTHVVYGVQLLRHIHRDLPSIVPYCAHLV